MIVASGIQAHGVFFCDVFGQTGQEKEWAVLSGKACVVSSASDDDDDDMSSRPRPFFVAGLHLLTWTDLLYYYIVADLSGDGRGLYRIEADLYGGTI